MKDIHTVPARLKAAYFSYIWGGTLLRDLAGKDTPADDIGESWEVSAHPRGQATVATGPAAGMAFGEYAAGTGFYGGSPAGKFPLLVKLLGAKENLSVQVHPSDDNCGPGEAGKAEAWYVVASEPGAELIYGINCSVAELAAAIAGGTLREKLRRLPVRPGDVLDIPPGTVHALTAGIVVYEVQQNSDTTYRLYDWGRVDAKTGMPRALHVEDALRVIQPDAPAGTVAGLSRIEPGGARRICVVNPRYTLEEIRVDGRFADAWFNAFAAYTVVAGEGGVRGAGGETLFSLRLGDSFVSPAAAGPVTMEGSMTLLKAHVPPQQAYGNWMERLAP